MSIGEPDDERGSLDKQSSYMTIVIEVHWTMHLVHVVMSRNHHNACVCVHGCGCTSVCVCECACVRASMCAQAFICIQRTCALQNVCIDVCVLCKRGKFMLSVSKVNFRSSVIHVSVRECLLKTLT